MSDDVCIGSHFYVFLFPSDLILRWAKDFYEFAEDQVATVELVTDSMFETSVSIQGNPRRIPDDDSIHSESLLVCGPQIISGSGVQMHGE